MIKLSLLTRQGLTAAVVSTVAALALALTTACSVNHYDNDRGHRYPPPPAAQKAPPRGPAHQAPAPRPSHKAPPRSPHRYRAFLLKSLSLCDWLEEIAKERKEVDWITDDG